MTETTCKAQVCLAIVSECLAAYPGTAATGSVILAVLLQLISGISAERPGAGRGASILRETGCSGEVTCNVRIWMRHRLQSGAVSQDGGEIEVDSIELTSD